MSNPHGYSTRRTTHIEQTIEQLAAQLPQRTRMSNPNDNGAAVDSLDNINMAHGGGNIGNERMEWLVSELAQLREELGRFQLQQQQQHTLTTTISPNMTPVQVMVTTDPLQQMKDFVKPFHGHMEEDVHKWIESIVHYFNIAKLPGNQEALYLQYAPAFLKSYAYQWWKENKRNDWDWNMFKQSIVDQFGKMNEYLIGRQLDQRKQQYNESVLKYYYDMMDLCNKYDPTMSNKQKIYKLTNGLRLSLYQEAMKTSYSTPTEFLTKVQQIESIQQLVEQRQMQARAPNDEYNEPQVDESQRYYTNRDNRRRNGYEQTATNDNRISTNSYKTNNQIQCYRCKENGHISRNCPQINKLTIDNEQSNQKNE